jgi:Ribbon-helix-helix domain
MSEPETTRLTITWPKEADHVFHQTVREVRQAFADVSLDELQHMIDEAVEDVRARHYRERAERS